MIVIVGLVILVAAVIAGVAGVLANGGDAHAVTHFAVFGYHVTGSTGTLFLYGIITGALALAGLSLLLAGARRTSRRGRAARQSLRQSRRETAAVSQDRDNLIGQRDTARAYTAREQRTHAARSATATVTPAPGPAATPGRAGRACSRAGPQGGRKRCPARPPRPPPPRPPPARPRPRNDPRRTAPMSIARKIAHKAEAVKGAFKKTAGRATGNRRLRAEGRRDQAKGNLKQAGAKAKDAVKH